MRIVLASQSQYRAQLLGRIITNFEQDRPDIDESPLPDESPAELAQRLAREKADAIASRWDNSLIIGSDQVAYIENSATNAVPMLSKPGNFDKAYQQLRLCSNSTVTYLTACCLLNSSTRQQHCFYDSYQLHFKALSDRQITDYLTTEQPYDCAGAIKSEGLGVALVKAYSGTDPSTLIGLPLIKLIEALEKENYLILGS